MLADRRVLLWLGDVCFSITSKINAFLYLRTVKVDRKDKSHLLSFLQVYKGQPLMLLHEIF